MIRLTRKGYTLLISQPLPGKIVKLSGGIRDNTIQIKNQRLHDSGSFSCYISMFVHLFIVEREAGNDKMNFEEGAWLAPVF